ncbi:hypothetical protein ACHAWU_007908 [Discostella pseudostelligera]|uniref:Uncharacterized protein n=1 Tax=Discostella pseudostelligera TaxID=259834 RepID=A0ABD3MB56_9STRA
MNMPLTMKASVHPIIVSITLFVVHCIGITNSLSLHHISTNVDLRDEVIISIARRDVLRRTAASATATAVSLASHPSPCYSAADDTIATTTGLARRLSLRDPSQLKNSVFNIPPKAQVYPDFLRGQWDVTMKYRGFLFPSTSIPKEKLVSDISIPGFQKLSIAQVADVGRELTTYQMSIDPVTGFEDRSISLTTSINAHLGYDAVREILYNRKDNPNRISIDFIPNRTRNANRIELFCNARESELVVVPQAPTSSSASSSSSQTDTSTIFVCSEHIRQVTFGLSQEFGVARQVVGNYAHFWTWKEDNNNQENNIMTGNLLTAAYLDAQDALFFEEPSKPVVVYSHDLVARKRS